MTYQQVSVEDQFWISPPEVNRDDHDSRHAAEENDRRADVAAAIEVHKRRAEDRDDFESSREHREWLAERYPGATWQQFAETGLGWWDAFHKNPAQAREQWIRNWSAQAPFHHKPKSKPEVKEPEGLNAVGKRNWQADQDAKNGYAQAKAKAQDREDFANSGKLRAVIKERTGLSLTDFMDKLRSLDSAALDNPVGVADRLYFASGGPATQAQVNERAAAAQYQQHERQVGQWLDGLHQSGQLPADYGMLTDTIGNVLQDMNRAGTRTGNYATDLATAIPIARRQHAAGEIIEGMRKQLPHYDQLEPVIAEVLERGLVPKSGDMARDLAAAHQVAWQQRHQAAQTEQARLRAIRGSIKGSPSPGASSTRSGRRDFSVSYEDDLNADIRAALYAHRV